MVVSENASKDYRELRKTDSDVYTERLDGILIYSLVTMLLVTAYWLVIGEWVRGGNYVVFTLNTGVVFWMRRLSRRPRWTTSFYLASLLGMLVVDSLLTGLDTAPALWVLPIVPMLAGHLMGSGALAWWSVYACLGILVVHGVASAGWEPPPVTIGEEEPLFVLLSTSAGYARIGYAALMSIEKSVDRSNREVAELIQSRFSADRASAAKSAFLANMSEQIKIPLQGAIDDSKALLREVSRSEQQSCLALDESVRRVSTIVNDIVDISRMENGVFLAESSPLDLRLLFDSLALDIFDAAESRGIKVRWDVQVAPCRVVGDSRRLSRLVNILVRDAVASADTQVEAVVGMLPSDSQETPGLVQMQIRVSRDGEPQLVERSDLVFGMRIHENELNVDVKTGLGLAMAESICQFMDGSLEFLGQDPRGRSVTLAKVYLANQDAPYLVSSEDQSRCA